MKQIIKFVILILLGHSTISCESFYGKSVEPELSVWSHEFPKDGGTFFIHSNVYVTVDSCTSEGERYSDPDSDTTAGPWFTVINNPDTFDIEITVDKNTSGQRREFYISIQNLNWYGTIHIYQDNQ